MTNPAPPVDDARVMLRQQIVSEIMKLVRKPAVRIKPTIEELERILNSENPPDMQIEPDGMILSTPQSHTTVGDIADAILRIVEPAPSPTADEARTKRQWIIDLIREEYDPKPSNWRANDKSWNDGAETIADKILAQHEDGSTFESTVKDLMEHIAMLNERIAALSRIPSEEATAQYIDGILESYDQTTLANDVCGDEFIERLAQDGFRITRAPGAKTSARNALQGE